MGLASRTLRDKPSKIEKSETDVSLSLAYPTFAKNRFGNVCLIDDDRDAGRSNTERKRENETIV